MTRPISSQKRLAAAVKHTGVNKIWLDPNEQSDIKSANSRLAIRKLAKDGLIIKKPAAMHSRDRVRKNLAAKRKGRHTGTGKRKGTREARMPSQVLWLRRQRVLRRLLKKFRAQKKITAQIYRKMYQKSKGNIFKSRAVLVEKIHQEKHVKARADAVKAQQESKIAKARATKERKRLAAEAKAEAAA